jgi:hypothetical protein
LLAVADRSQSRFLRYDLHDAASGPGFQRGDSTERHDPTLDRSLTEALEDLHDRYDDELLRLMTAAAVFARIRVLDEIDGRKPTHAISPLTTFAGSTPVRR